MSETCVAIGLGSNLGDRRARLRGALSGLELTRGFCLEAVSSFRETAPVGGPADQPDFLNAALVGWSTLPPIELLERLQELELAAGRERATEVRWGPRALDLDLLLYGDLELDTEHLVLPHPRMEQRAFVLEPLAEIAPTLRMPRSGATIAELARRLLPGAQRR